MMSNLAARIVPASSTDPRAQRTRAAIVAATSALFAANGGEFSVQQIADRAGISRASFYTHFSGVDEVLEVILQRAFDGVRDTFEVDLRATDDPRAVSRANTAIVDTVLEHREVLTGMLTGPMRADAQDAIARSIAHQVGISLANRLNPEPEGVDRAITAAYVGGAAATVLAAWLTGRLDASREQIVANLSALLPAWLGTARRDQ